MFFGFWWDWTLIILIPGILLTLWAQVKVKSSYTRYESELLPSHMTGAAVARRILDANGLSHLPIEMVRGHLSDHYDPREKVLRLSEAVYHGNNVAAVGVAAHEAGHALQDEKGYVPLRFRIAMVPVCNIGSHLAMPLFIIGLLFAGLGAFADWLMFAGIAVFSLSVLFQLVTLPVEFNASRRALRCLEVSGTMNDEQLKGSRKVLSAAAMTYVAALAVGLLSLLRLLLIMASASGRRNR
ncbi:MAG: zinc metallopeptidase [Ruminococcaceae bacterium]|nr:zinc metallopeptidase [Oscillospiraceae bacterium]